LQNEVIKPTVEGMISIMQACKEAGTVRRIVFTSSAGTVNVEERRKPVYDEDSWTDVDFCRRVKMTGWVTYLRSDFLCPTTAMHVPSNTVFMSLRSHVLVI
jgi:bifunctional dihydroflavonol 4-reductase/flavanone 4-reductase